MIREGLEQERLTYLVQELAPNPRALCVLIAMINDFRRAEHERIAKILDVWAQGQGSLRYGDDERNEAVKRAFALEAQQLRTLGCDDAEIRRFVEAAATKAGYKEGL